MILKVKGLTKSVSTVLELFRSMVRLSTKLTSLTHRPEWMMFKTWAVSAASLLASFLYVSFVV
jgi:hypothetical protein